MGSLTALGCRTGVARIFGVKLSGFLAWFLWRTVYLVKMPGFARKVRVALDWTLDLVFRRDFVQLGVHRAPGLARQTAGTGILKPGSQIKTAVDGSGRSGLGGGSRFRISPGTQCPSCRNRVVAGGFRQRCQAPQEPEEPISQAEEEAAPQ